MSAAVAASKIASMPRARSHAADVDQVRRGRTQVRLGDDADARDRRARRAHRRLSNHKRHDTTKPTCNAETTEHAENI